MTTEPSNHFTYLPRPPVPPTEDHPTQRYFPTSASCKFGFGIASSREKFVAVARVMRLAQNNHGELSLRVSALGEAEIMMPFTADELREIAKQCLDCAHDLDTFPAEVLTAERES